MADKEHLEIIKQGVDQWNQWRESNSTTQPDLSHADLSRMVLVGVNLSEANLRNADLSNANLSEANFDDADLRIANLRISHLKHASLQRADLMGANLSYTYLVCANLIDVNLGRADLSRSEMAGANLMGTNLGGANLSNAEFKDTNLTGASIGWTTFGNNDLREVKGLDTLSHHGPSSIGIDTIYRSGGAIPEIFLRRAGVPENFVTYMTSLTGEAIQFYSCFLSHAEHDGEFAERLRNDLISNNVSCWHYRYDMRGGQFWRVQVNQAIKIHEKLVLICSKEATQRRNVVDEIIIAMERERETNSQKLFPIRLDDFILSKDVLKIADEKMESEEWREDWVRYVRAYHIPDFRDWKNHDAYQKEFLRLLEALQNPAKR